MKQMIGYMEYDFKSIKQGLALMLAIFGIVSIYFIKESGLLMGMTYLLFGAMVISGIPFGYTKTGTVSFYELLPGTTLQKVAGRFLFGMAAVLISVLFSLLAFLCIKGLSFQDGGTQVPLVAVLLGIVLFMIAFQNLLLYLLEPYAGAQLLSIARMVPGFVTFFAMMKLLWVGEGSLPEMAFAKLPDGLMAIGMAILAVGILSQFIAIFFSWLVVKKRVGV